MRRPSRWSSPAPVRRWAACRASSRRSAPSTRNSRRTSKSRSRSAGTSQSVEERGRLTQEVLELRAAEERLMLMERIEKELEESSSEVQRLRRRGAAGSDAEPLSLKELRTEQVTPQLAGAAMKDGAKPRRMLGGRVPEAGPAGFKLRPGSWNAAVLQG